jgi:hypothetical protein
VYKEGEKVNVIYDPDDNNHFIIDGYINRILGFVVMAIGILIIAAVFIYYILMQY